jgi:hypothetical protein
MSVESSPRGIDSYQVQMGKSTRCNWLLDIRIRRAHLEDSLASEVQIDVLLDVFHPQSLST